MRKSIITTMFSVLTSCGLAAPVLAPVPAFAQDHIVIQNNRTVAKLEAARINKSINDIGK